MRALLATPSLSPSTGDGNDDSGSATHSSVSDALLIAIEGGVGHRREESGRQEEEGGSPHGIAGGEGDSLECFAWVAVGGSASSKWGRANIMHAGVWISGEVGGWNKHGPQIRTLLDPGQNHTSVPSTEPAHARSRVIKLHALAGISSYAPLTYAPRPAHLSPQAPQSARCARRRSCVPAHSLSLLPSHSLASECSRASTPAASSLLRLANQHGALGIVHAPPHTFLLPPSPPSPSGSPISTVRSASFILPRALQQMVEGGTELGAADDALFGRSSGSRRGSGTVRIGGSRVG